MKPALLLFMFFVLCLFSCKKEIETAVPGNDIISLVFNKGAISTLNKEKKEIIVDIADFINRSALVAIFQLSDGATATINGQLQYSSDTPNDFTKPVIYTITSSRGEIANWTVIMQSNNYRIGLGKVVTAEKRLETQNEWYVSQDTSGVNFKMNGGPACIVMAMKWLDPIKSRELTIQRIGGLVPFTGLHFDKYFSQNNIPYKLITLTNDPKDITEQIDRGNLVIMLPDFAGIPYNQLKYQYTNRIYPTFEPYIPTTGHWMIVKGYKKVDNELYFETYDPYSKGERYENGEPKGRNRYYNSTYIMNSLSMGNGWKYAFVLCKGLSNTNEVLRNEVFMPYFELPLSVVENIPKLGTYVRVAYGY